MNIVYLRKKLKFLLFSFSQKQCFSFIENENLIKSVLKPIKIQETILPDLTETKVGSYTRVLVLQVGTSRAAIETAITETIRAVQ